MCATLKKIELKHANQLARWRDDWAKRLDAFGQLRTALTEFSSFMKTINTEEKFLVKSVSVSNSTLCSVTNSVGAMDGTYQVHVDNLATNSYLTVEANVSKTTDKISDSSGNFTYQYDKDGDGTMETYSVPVTPDTTLQGLANLINNDKNNPGATATIMEMGVKLHF